jgi:hypothetical protein
VLLCAVTATVSACSNGQKSQTLSRSVAKDLIEKSPTALKPYSNMNFSVSTHLTVPGDVPKDTASEVQAFLNDLVTAGIATNLHTIPFPGSSGVPPGITYILSAIPQEGVELANANTPYESISIPLGEPTVEEITGIQQEGTDAIVDVTLKNAPTHLYQKLSDVAKNEVAVCGHTDFIHTPTYCIGWPTPDRLTSEKQTRFQFSRFDDGWRLTH